VTDEARSVLGRYVDAGGGGSEQLVEVRLLNFPLQLFDEARQHHDELMREFSLLALQSAENRPEVPARLLELIDQLGRRYGASGERSDTVREQAIARGEAAMDLTYHLPPSAATAILTLHELMEAADEFCRTEQLLTVASTPAERDFREWYLDQFTSQLDGGEPVPWNGPMSNEDQVVTT